MEYGHISRKKRKSPGDEMDDSFPTNEQRPNNNGVFIIAVAILVVLAIVFYIWSN